MCGRKEGPECFRDSRREPRPMNKSPGHDPQGDANRELSPTPQQAVHDVFAEQCDGVRNKTGGLKVTCVI